MIVDELLMFGDNDAPGNIGTNLADNQIDMSVVRDVGQGQPMYLVIRVTTTFVGATGTCNFRLRSDDTASIDPSTSTAHWESGAIAVADLAEGKTFVVALPIEGNAYEQYLGLQYVVATASFTAGGVDSYLTIDPPNTKFGGYADGAN